jgi:hypothetical protein
MSANKELTAGPAKLHSQIFYYTARGFINNKIHALNRRSLQYAVLIYSEVPNPDPLYNVLGIKKTPINT